ncbi:TPA: hypothetical protein ACGSSW_005610, partial [Klebsiella pneumoniae]
RYKSCPEMEGQDQFCINREPGSGSLSSQTKHSPGKSGRFRFQRGDHIIFHRVQGNWIDSD